MSCHDTQSTTGVAYISHADLASLRIGSKILLDNQKPSARGALYEIDQIFDIESATLARFTRGFHAHRVDAPHSGACVNLTTAGTRWNGDVVPGHTRDCLPR